MINVPNIEHYISRLTPNVYPLNVLLIAPLFYRRFGRVQRRPSHPNADYHDFLVDRMARNGWSDLELRCVDKEFAKQAAKELVPDIYVPETIEVIQTPRGTTFDEFNQRLQSHLGKHLVAKPTHGNNATVFLDRATDQDIEMLYRWSRYNHFYSFRETQYAGLHSKLIIEQNLFQDGIDLRDFKFFCSKGKILFVQVDAERFIHHKRILVEPPDFTPMSVHLGSFARATEWDRPECFDKMCETARALATPFKFVRIDLYEVRNEIFLGEFTFTPGGGMEPFSDASFSRELMMRITS